MTDMIFDALSFHEVGQSHNISPLSISPTGDDVHFLGFHVYTDP